jgi:hypothetical protein
MSAYMPIRELVDFPQRKPEELLLLIRAYFDDSGTHSNSDVVVLRGPSGLT